MDNFLRQLQYSTTGDDPFNSTMSDPFDEHPPLESNSTQGTRHGRDAYEFVAFLLWYLFLVLCCVIPTCCAYRRRRLVEARIAQQQASVNRIERQNLFILSSLRHSQHNTERIREQRGTKLAEKLKETTMTVEEQNIVDICDETIALPCNRVRIVDEAENDTEDGIPQASTVAVEFDVESPDVENTHCLQLPAKQNIEGGESTNRTVPGACAICLCPYEQGEEVTWSPKVACQHAFHSECIIPWLAKTDEPKCPCCRQDFCDPVPMSQLELDPISIFGPATSLAGLGDDGDDDVVIPHFMRTLEASRLEFLASLELATVDASGRRSLAIHPPPDRSSSGGTPFTSGGAPFSLGGSPFEIHHVESEERPEPSSSNAARIEGEDSNNVPAPAEAESEPVAASSAGTPTVDDNSNSGDEPPQQPLSPSHPLESV